MRAYFLGNYYLSQIQQGIQASHVVGEMHVKYHSGNELVEASAFDEWAIHHKTMILLNGGNQSDLQKFYDFISSTPYVKDLVHAKFHESESALNGALTSVGIIVPEFLYDKPVLFDNDKSVKMYELHRRFGSKAAESYIQLMVELQSRKLA
jgi:hypothetical protein